MMRWALLLGLGLIACTDASSPTPQSQTAAIFGGEPERGHTAVGAVLSDGLCTGTLIRPTWVLTAAHCLDSLPPAELVAFVTARDVRGPSPPDQNDFHAIRRYVIHPNWLTDGPSTVYDLALIELRAAPRRVEPYGLFTAGLEARIGAESLFVGYGIDQPRIRDGGGLKRRTTLPLEALTPTTMHTTHADSGVCFGDSGGPALIETAEGWQVAGVNSSGSDEFCRFGSMQIRVDAHLPWILSTIGEGGMCEPARCGCQAACANGACDPLGCAVGNGCRGLIECFSACETSICGAQCAEAASQQDRELFAETYGCAIARCQDAPDFFACAEASCMSLARCDADQPGELETCEAAMQCALNCPDQDCIFRCLERAVPAAAQPLEALGLCAFGVCGLPPDEDWQACARLNCGAEWAACIPPDNCALRGGDCGRGRACRPLARGVNDCEPTRDIRRGQACEGEGVLCEDGAVCHAERCRTVCENNRHCSDDFECVRAGQTGLGACVCLDDDDDGICNFDECQPVREQCGDGLDQDCDGRIDEGCEPRDMFIVDAAVPDMQVDQALPEDMAALEDMTPQDMRRPRDRGASVDAVADGAVDQGMPRPPEDTESEVALPIDRGGCQQGSGDLPAGWWVWLGLFALRNRRACV